MTTPTAADIAAIRERWEGVEWHMPQDGDQGGLDELYGTWWTITDAHNREAPFYEQDVVCHVGDGGQSQAERIAAAPADIATLLAALDAAADRNLAYANLMKASAELGNLREVAFNLAKKLDAANAERDAATADRDDAERLMLEANSERNDSVHRAAKAETERDAWHRQHDALRDELLGAMERSDAAQARVRELEADAKCLAEYPRMVDIMQNDELKAVCDRVLGYDAIRGPATGSDTPAPATPSRRRADDECAAPVGEQLGGKCDDSC